MASGDQKPDGAWAASQVADFLEEKIRQGVFYILCPDNEVTEEMDKKRTLWAAGDVVHGRQPLSRWRDEYKDQTKEFMDKPLGS